VVAQDSVLQPSNTDLEAQRILALAIALTNAPHPLPTSYFYENFYAQREPEAQKKAFQRDRERLSQCGFILVRTELPGEQNLWSVDQSSFATDHELSVADALALDVACLPLAADPSFPYAHDLRMALSKIDRSFSEVTAAKFPAEARVRLRTQDIVERCLSNHHAARINYTKASGEQVDRTVAVLGLFSLRNTPYMVAAQFENNGGLSEPHNYNMSRIASVKEVSSLSYNIPAGFDVHDYLLLPFQIGTEHYNAQIRVPAARVQEFMAIYGDKGRTIPDTTDVSPSKKTGSVLWDVDVRDTRGAAAWCIAEGVVPVFPEDLRCAWKTILESGESDGQ
jgi:predicted DNA-binding transcriptional regulator YafY